MLLVSDNSFKALNFQQYVKRYPISVVRTESFCKIGTESHNKRYPLSIPFAPFYGELNKEHMLWLSDHLKVTISSIVRTLQKARTSTELTWDTAHAALISALHIEETRSAEEWHVSVDLSKDTIKKGQLVKDVSQCELKSMEQRC